MPGVVRPYTLTDVLATINDQTGGGQIQPGNSALTFGLVGEADESVPGTSIADTATTTAAVPAGWDGGVWGAVGWQ